MLGEVIMVGDEKWHDTDDPRGLWRFSKPCHWKKRMSKDKAKTLARRRKRDQKRKGFA